MTGVVLSPRARADLDEIWDYSAEHWGQDQAEEYLRALWRGIGLVGKDPRRGRSCEAIRAGYYRYPIRSHVVFYRMTSTGIDVVRILHQRMDFQQHL